MAERPLVIDPGKLLQAFGKLQEQRDDALRQRDDLLAVCEAIVSLMGRVENDDALNDNGIAVELISIYEMAVGAIEKGN